MLFHYLLDVSLILIFLFFLFLNRIAKLLGRFRLDWFDVWFGIDVCIKWSCIFVCIKVLFYYWWMNMTEYILRWDRSKCVLKKLFRSACRHLKSLIQRVSQWINVDRISSFKRLVKIYNNFFLRNKLFQLLNWLWLETIKHWRLNWLEILIILTWKRLFWRIIVNNYLCWLLECLDVLLLDFFVLRFRQRWSQLHLIVNFLLLGFVYLFVTILLIRLVTFIQLLFRKV